MNNSLLKKLNITPYNTAFTILFFAGLILTYLEIEIFRHTFINYATPAIIWLLTGIIATPMLTTTLAVHYRMRSLFWHLFYNICSWGGIAVYAFMALNFYFSKGNVDPYYTNIIRTGELAKGQYGCGEPYAEIFYNGVEKDVIFPCGTPVQNYSNIELAIERGLFGIDVIKATHLLNEKKGSPLALTPIDYNVYFDSTSYKNTPLKIVQLGELNLPTGKIIVGDPLTSIYDADPLKIQVNPGKYPVIVCVAETEKSGKRYAAAKLEISKNRAVKWELALRAKQRIEDLKGDQTFGFPVDAGLGCFVDIQTRNLFNQYDDSFTKKDKTWNIYDGVLATEFKKNATNPNDPKDAGDWVNFYLPNKPDQNIIMFQSGYGDGFYSAYWGLDDKGLVCSLVIDFQVL